MIRPALRQGQDISTTRLDGPVRLLLHWGAVVMVTSILKEDEGAQVVEYALIIAVVSIALVIALQPLTPGASFGNFIARVGTCLTTAACL
jgi:pilus assembly protein Flp/PilA